MAGVSWRLAQGPIAVGWLAEPVRAALSDNDAAGRVSFDGLALAWEGFQKGVDHPLDLRISNLVMQDAAGRRLLAAADAHITFSFAGLLLGRFVPRSIEVDHGQVTVTREASGQVNLGWDPTGADTGETEGLDLGQVRQQLARPASGDHGPSHGVFDQIQRAHFRDAAVTFRDRESGLTVVAAGLDVDLTRGAIGHVRGVAEGRLAVGGAQTALTAGIDFVAGGTTTIDARLAAFRPAVLAGLPPALAFITDLDAPVSVTAAVVLDAGFKPNHVTVAATVGAGRLRAGQGDVPLRGAAIALSGGLEAIDITRFHLDLPGSAGGVTGVDLTGSVARLADRLTASGTLGVDQFDIADLARFWPAGLGSGGARPWVTEHVTSGVAAKGLLSFTLEADTALHDIVVTKASGDLDASNAAFTWLDNMPAVEQAMLHLHLADPDTLEIRLLSGRQRVGKGSADLVARDGLMRISGLAERDQSAQIHVEVDGPVISALSLLGEPRLHLLSAHPIGLAPAGGDAAAALDFQFPLENKLQIDDVQIHAAARLTRIRVPSVVAGQDLDDGAFDLSVDKDGLSLRGRGLLAHVPMTLDGTMDFNQGPLDQIVQRISVNGKPDAAQLGAAGLPVAGVVSGPIPISAVLVERRGGTGSVAIGGDLTQARLAFSPLGWSKPAGVIASATTTLLMSHDRPVKLDRIAVTGSGVALSGTANFVDGRVRSVQLDTIRLGRTQGHGTLNVVPGTVLSGTAAAGSQIDIALQGSQIDLGPKLTEKTTGATVPQGSLVTTPAWKLSARFDRALLANGEEARNLLANVTGGGETVRLLDAVGTMQPLGQTAGQPSGQAGGQGSGDFSIRIDPRGNGRRLSVEAKDAGRFLRGLDTIRGMESGHLTINGDFDGPFGLQPVAGTAVIDDVVVRNSPALGKLLQAITLYGLVDVLRGPGISFSRIVAPYQYDGNDLVLTDARAANPSLGLTAKGRIGLASGQLEISGTIVPAYFFNSMLGQLPLVGKLFSPEKGGGVFAARFGLDGPIDNPLISLNPISALTPGFLRDIFGIFDKDGAGSRGTAPKPP